MPAADRMNVIFPTANAAKKILAVPLACAKKLA
jgi:hypothetical protein